MGELVKNPFYVPRQVFLDAKHYVERQRLRFFDFYRNCAFGFVEVAPRRGHYAQVAIVEDGELSSRCPCREAEYDEVCGHAFALYLKFIHWPFEKKPIHEQFENHPLCRFLKTAGRSIYRRMPNPQSNPALFLPDFEEEADQRLLNYWGFTGDEGVLAKRDRKALEAAQHKVRTPQEWKMLNKNFPSARILFEESALYRVCKLFFHLERRGGLNVTVTSAADHQVDLRVEYAGSILFSWRLPVETYLKGMRADWDFWRVRTDFEVRKQGVSLTYRIHFTEGNDLEIEPMVTVAHGRHLPLSDVQVPQHRNLYFHDRMGYFRIQTGLSPFEMTYAEPAVHTVNHQKVAGFLKQHRETLEALDRTLMDETLFGEVVAERFDRFRLKLDHYQSGRFRFGLHAELGEHQFAIEELQRLLSQSGRYRKLGGKLFDSASYDGSYLKSLADGGKEPGQLDVRGLLRLLTFFRDRMDVDAEDPIRVIFEDIKNFKTPPPPKLDQTQLKLRPYQQLGYEWLYFLKTYGLGGLLCDQMGLGKTHQGMALLAATIKENEHARAVIVAPTSVLFHWQDKLAAFCPNLKIALYHGPDRDASKALSEPQILLTSYGTLRNDFEAFLESEFDLIIFDEIQYLKNKDTLGYRNLSRLRAACKVGLTGTPIENKVTEIKSLMDLVLPGFMGGDAQFRRYFADPILKFEDQAAKEKLHTAVKPFTLRRSKLQVLQELPAKIEDIRTYYLTQYERTLYREVKAKGRKGAFDEDGKPRGAMHIFQLIDKLKQLCNHPALYFKNHDYMAYPSAKWELFTELLREALDSGEKIVVFSQYLGMIDMFRQYLIAEGVAFASITGQTRDRAAEQKRFMTDPNCRVFLGSLLASGVGIDLTAGSIVIHYDRWWNPAREEQASDRVHRIGQNKNVQVFKFLALTTVEERIDQIIRKKQGLLDEVVGFDSESLSKTFTIEELLEILS